MSVKVALEHRTTYRFARPVTVLPHVVRLRPAPHARTPVEAYSLTVEPAGHQVNWQQDPFGNWQARLYFPEKVRTLEISVGLVADLVVVNPFDFFVETYAATSPFGYPDDLAESLAPYLRPVPDADGVAALDERVVVPDGGSTVSLLGELNAVVHAAVGYTVRMETGVQTPDETLASAIGSCRDSAWLLVALLRRRGLAARFVSGYLVQLAADDPSTGGPKEDFTDLHAWAEVYLPGAGWVGLDPTSALFAGEGHLPLSATPYPAAAAPIDGATEPVEVEMSFHHEVRRIHEPPRPTRPYTEEQWASIDALGAEVDRRLEAGDVRLTMGGEPTFVALATESEAASPQWRTQADGVEKRAAAGVLASRLFDRWAVGGVVHRGQGKWYPGEPLPRWNIALQWRTDGEPLWRDAALLADPWSPGSDAEVAREQAEALAGRVTRTLGLPEGQLQGAFEDPLAALASEVRQPDGPRPDGALDRLDAQGLGVLDASVDQPSGWVLPLSTGEEWTSAAWRFRRGRLVLTPGTSAVGLRLPLESVSWSYAEGPGEPSYVEAGPPLEPGVPVVRVVDPEVTDSDESESAAVTALAFEAREGHVHVFLPPTERLEDYADLLRLLEVAARRVGCPVVIEGYGPPPDARLTQLVVTPDPGVIEINVHPAGSWAELSEITTVLDEEARAVGLTTETFEWSGRHAGTGGGSHLTLGGPVPQASPLLRRPELLASLVTYWQRHPSLSYLFSGRFVGPTSQAPRFDEGRPEAVGEMEIALAEVRRLVAEQDAEGLEPRPWLVDRALRHLLTDLTGNTHRAELCIDKLYSPDSSRGRLGLLELRGFEMAPHPRMALTQALLVRALVSMLWDRPYQAPLVRWGTRLHDSLLLPHGCEADAREVVADLRAAGLAFEEEWLAPFVEFRFPVVGSVTAGPVRLELRQAIEPWHVLGEEASGSGTARYVDSSLDRLQVLASGYDPSRHLVTCGGVPLPLAPTGDGSHYAGVRFKAWELHSALHPTIDSHAPLRFEVVDAANAVSLGGATYHVVHPGGLLYDAPPVNANEAEARRARRFEPFGHTAGRVDVVALREAGRRASSADLPHTLDLRRTVAGSGT